MTEEKVSELKRQFPEADEASLLELLVVCDGSLSSAERLLMETFPKGPTRKRSKVARQASIQSLMSGPVSKRLVSTNTSGSNKPVLLYTKEAIETTVPYSTIHYNFLPKDLADSLLQTIMDDTADFVSSEFYLFGNRCVSKHDTKMYSSKPIDGIFYNGVETKNKSEFTDFHGIAQVLIEDQVNMEINERGRLPFQHQGQWVGDLALCNKFYTKSNNLDWHSDRLTYIGPHCTIASLSLGATREFRVRKQYCSDDATSRFNTIYSIPLPHNTLLIMHAGFQEEFKHCVSSTTELIPHPVSGTLRVNLTYRHYLPRYKDHIPQCELCHSPMELRRVFKDPRTRGRYVWMCSRGYQGRDCAGKFYADFSADSLIAKDFNSASLWIAPDDHEALQAFRESIGVVN